MTTQNPRGTRRGSNGEVRYTPTGPAPSSLQSAQQLTALPSPMARGLAFFSILLGGILGGLIGYGFVNVSNPRASSTARAVATSIGSILVAMGTAVLAVLVLRAMGEWRRIDASAGQSQLGADR